MEGDLYVWLQAVFLCSAGCPSQLQLTVLLSNGPGGEISVRKTSLCPCSERYSSDLASLKNSGAAGRWRSVNSLALLANIRNGVFPLLWIRNYLFIGKIRRSHFLLARLPLQIGESEMNFWKSRSCTRGGAGGWRVAEGVVKWLSRKMKDFHRWLFMGVKNVLPYSPPEQGNFILHHKCFNSSGNSGIEAHAPFVYLLYSDTEGILVIRERGKISSVLHLEVD